MRLRRPSSGELSAAAGLAPYYLETSGPLNWSDLFGNPRPVEVEVGCGKGLFVITAATQHPETNYFGIEISRKYALFTADRVARRSLGNARIACADARRVLRDWIADASVSALHVYFPDPWWKRRHKKRRVFTEEFVRHAARILQPGGELRVASDVEEYFQLIRELVAACPALERREVPPERLAEHDLDYLTNFERKYRKAGKQVFRAIFMQCSRGGTSKGSP